ncbi:MAG: SagB/ThcOx family dehydrogenase [Sulfuricurvum sp.]|jgi:SagB-type dehydrogenase family enzyme|uniref:SagB/ThcOx family dehydrogenase n=1 Tax=Sulfuricurvum sp. TaxID=2025608 RepID=UPI0025D6FA67|nr:SagB/ThcOx family dehydrogenase [Sulfuricurvum sp.]MCK9374385.1 SagB/ThcOx family dehydrogenase [Sulfuricurvum sp.]
MKTIATLLDYHDRTKHRRARYAASLGYMDWATQPDPFRRYKGATLIPLTHSEATPPYHLLFQKDPLPTAPLCYESLSQLLRYSLGLAAIKSHGGSSWALRCNASSGNLHPTECYVIAPSIEGISDHATLSHYAPREHALELLHTYDSSLEEGTFFIALSSVVWREAWKYGERCWRYCQLDAGHAYQSINIAASMLGWKCELLNVDSTKIASLCGLDQVERFDPNETESPDLLIRIGAGTSLTLPHTPKISYDANRLSPAHHLWPVLEVIADATKGIYPKIPPLKRGNYLPAPSKSSGEIILKRRSAQMMDGSTITQEQFRSLLSASLLCENTSNVHFVLFVHRVEGLGKGLYLYVRDKKDLISLQQTLDETFTWKECDEGLYLLREGDFRGAAQMVSCNQEIAKEGAFSFGMLCTFSSALEIHGGIGYKNLYHQCGMIGQMLYLEATSLHLSATGIGCFLDDEFHALLGIRDQRYQSLYHFTIGRAIVDTRITTLPPY